MVSESDKEWEAQNQETEHNKEFIRNLDSHINTLIDTHAPQNKQQELRTAVFEHDKASKNFHSLDDKKEQNSELLNKKYTSLKSQINRVNGLKNQEPWKAALLNAVSIKQHSDALKFEDLSIIDKANHEKNLKEKIKAQKALERALGNAVDKHQKDRNEQGKEGERGFKP